MTTVNSVSGGRSSAYLMANYPADYNLFSLIRINKPEAAPKDPWIKKYVESKIDEEFIATAEDDTIFYTLNDLEQYTGQEIIWVKNESFDELIERKRLPNQFRRICTQDLKVSPIAYWIYKNTKWPVEERLGFRANETKRVDRYMERLDKDGLKTEKIVTGKRENGWNRYKTIHYAKGRFPLHEDGIYQKDVIDFWKGKPVRFAERNNCIGCFHRSPHLLNLESKLHPEKFNWFVEKENSFKERINTETGAIMDDQTWKLDVTYEKIKSFRTQLNLFGDDFTECDSGYCDL